MLIRTAVLTSRRLGSSPGPGQRKPAPELGLGLVGAGGVEGGGRQHGQLGLSCHVVQLLYSCHVVQLLDSCCQEARPQLIARPAPAQVTTITTTITTEVNTTTTSVPSPVALGSHPHDPQQQGVAPGQMELSVGEVEL